jgi:hypothetical protein
VTLRSSWTSWLSRSLLLCVVAAVLCNLAGVPTARADDRLQFTGTTLSISAVLLVLVGLYVGYYGIYEVRLFHGDAGSSDPVIGAAGRVGGDVAAWVHQRGARPWLLAGAVLAALATLASVWRRQKRHAVDRAHSRDAPAATRRYRNSTDAASCIRATPATPRRWRARPTRR